MKEWSYNQREVAAWKSGVFPPSENTPRAEFERSLEEVTELDKAILNYDGFPKSKEEVAGEIADVMIRMYGIASVIGVDVDKMVKEKIILTKDKYPPKVITGRLAEGVPFEVAMAERKSEYQNQTPWQKRWEKRLVR